MDAREALFNGTDVLKPMVEADEKADKKTTAHVRNIVFENIAAYMAGTPQNVMK